MIDLPALCAILLPIHIHPWQIYTRKKRTPFPGANKLNPPPPFDTLWPSSRSARQRFMITALLSLKIYDALLIPLIDGENLCSWVRFFLVGSQLCRTWANGKRGSAARNNTSGS